MRIAIHTECTKRPRMIQGEYGELEQGITLNQLRQKSSEVMNEVCNTHGMRWMSQDYPDGLRNSLLC